MLGDRLLGASDRPPRPAEDFSDDPRAEELDRLCAARGFGRLGDLEDTAVAELAAALDAFEGEISDERHHLFAELDDLSEELVRPRTDERAHAPLPVRTDGASEHAVAGRDPPGAR